MSAEKLENSVQFVEVTCSKMDGFQMEILIKSFENKC